MGSFTIRVYERVASVYGRSLKRTFPRVHRLVYSRPNEFRHLKALIGFIYGMLIGVAFYQLILVDLEFTTMVRLAIGGIICLMLGIGNAVSVQIRCISLLTFPAFCGRAGRGVLKAVVLAYIVAGPIQNLSANGREVVRVFACTTSLAFNLTRTRFELMFKPFRMGLLKMKADVNELKDTARSIRDVVLPVVEEMEGEEEMRSVKEENDYIDTLQGDTKRSEDLNRKFPPKLNDTVDKKFEKGYRKKLELRCQGMVTKAGSKCRAGFDKAYDRCYNKVTWAFAWLLCWPMKLTFVCNLIGAIGGENICDSAKGVDPGFGEGYSFLKKSRSSLTEGFKKAKIQYQLGAIPSLRDVREATDTARAVLHDFQNKKHIADGLLLIVKRLMAFIFIRIILSAQEYHDKYLRDINFDNMYLTRYFRKIDARRRAKEEHTLLPLKKMEKPHFVDPYSILPSKKERTNLGTQTMKLMLEMITPVAFVLLDLLLFQTLDLVRRNAHIEYAQTGHHDLSLTVRGTGMIAKLVRSILGGFNVKKRIKTVRSNEACLPRPHSTPSYYYIKIFGTYALIWILALVQTYVSRLQRVFCAYFYPKREKKRVLFLYNETLQRRMGSIRFLGGKVRRMAREQRIEMETNIFMVLRLRFPHIFAWLRFFSYARRKCLVCGEPEPFKTLARDLNFHECMTPTCRSIYCKVCWKEMGEICYSCSVPEGSDSEEDEDVL